MWIGFIAGREPYARGLDKVLSQDEVVGHERELLIGDRGGRAKLLAAYARMHQVPAVPHADLVQFVRDRRLFGRGVGWVDVHLLASAMVGRLEVWTAEPRFAAAARELDLSYAQSV